MTQRIITRPRTVNKLSLYSKLGLFTPRRWEIKSVMQKVR